MYADTATVHYCTKAHWESESHSALLFAKEWVAEVYALGECRRRAIELRRFSGAWSDWGDILVLPGLVLKISLEEVYLPNRLWT
jgi:hypothetical protein